MNDEIEFDVKDIGENYIIINKNENDILNDIDFNNEDERLLCESIITNLEKDAASAIREMKTVSLPFIGCLRINPIKRKLRDAKLHLSLMRKNMSKADYKQHIKDIVHEFGQEMDKADAEKLIMTKIRRNNKKHYDELYKKLGRAYAEMFIFSIRGLKEIPYSQEWQEKYDELSGINRDKINTNKENKDKDIIKLIINNQPRYKFK